MVRLSEACTTSAFWVPRDLHVPRDESLCISYLSLAPSCGSGRTSL
jgi:hypothetical protein